jgi:hypothetical protein
VRGTGVIVELPTRPLPEDWMSIALALADDDT